MVNVGRLQGMLFAGKGFPWNSRRLSDGISAKITRPTGSQGLRWASRKFPGKYVQVTRKNNFKVDLFSIPLAKSYYNNEWTP